MILDAKANNFMGDFTNILNNLNKSQALSLEGNFDSYFTLYVPTKYEKDALYIFTPDVMARLIDSSRDFDIEIIGSNIYLYKKDFFNLDSSNELKSVFGVVDVIFTEIMNQTLRYKDEKVDNESLLYGEVHQSGVQLRKFNYYNLMIGSIVIFGSVLLCTLVFVLTK